MTGHTFLPFVRLLVCALALFRVAQWVARDLGPFRMWARLRAIAKRNASFYASEAKQGRRVIAAHLWRELADGLECVYCVGLWLSPLAIAAWYADVLVVNIVVIALAIVGAQAFMQGMVER